MDNMELFDLGCQARRQAGPSEPRIPYDEKIAEEKLRKVGIDPDTEEWELAKSVFCNGWNHEDWENSLEGINYRLGGVYGGTTVKDNIDEELICMVLQRVPKEVRDAVLGGSVTFILAANQEGTLFRIRFSPPEGQDYTEQDFILLNLKGSRKRKMTTIAHEIAHFYIARDTEYGPGDVKAELQAKEESAVDDLIETWGFTRAYSSYEQFERK